MRMLALAVLGALVAMTQPALAVEPPQNFAIHEAPVPLPEISFEDADGRPRTLAEFSGKVVLLNIWATWCVPCRKEMPTLDRLQAEVGGLDFEVVALSIDRSPDLVKQFFKEIGIAHLALNIDKSSKAMFALGVFGLPTTLLIDSKGKEVGRLIGPAEWDAPDMVAFIRRHVAAD